jgi:hypothetical protein
VSPTPERRTSDGGYIVQVNELRVGDRLGLTAGQGHVAWMPVLDIVEHPKTRTVTIGFGAGGIDAPSQMRRTTLVARAPREDEGESWNVE